MEKSRAAGLRRAKQRQPHKTSGPLPQTPQPGTFGRELGAATQASENKRNISKVKKHRNNSQVKEQKDPPEGTNNEIDLCGLTVQKGGNENTEGIQNRYQQ